MDGELDYRWQPAAGHGPPAACSPTTRPDQAPWKPARSRCRPAQVLPAGDRTARAAEPEDPHWPCSTSWTARWTTSSSRSPPRRTREESQCGRRRPARRRVRWRGPPRATHHPRPASERAFPVRTLSPTPVGVIRTAWVRGGRPGDEHGGHPFRGHAGSPGRGAPSDGGWPGPICDEPSHGSPPAGLPFSPGQRASLLLGLARQPDRRRSARTAPAASGGAPAVSYLAGSAGGPDLRVPAGTSPRSCRPRCGEETGGCIPADRHGRPRRLRALPRRRRRPGSASSPRTVNRHRSLGQRRQPSPPPLGKATAPGPRGQRRLAWAISRASPPCLTSDGFPGAVARRCSASSNELISAGATRILPARGAARCDPDRVPCRSSWGRAAASLPGLLRPGREPSPCLAAAAR